MNEVDKAIIEKNIESFVMSCLEKIVANVESLSKEELLRRQKEDSK